MKTRFLILFLSLLLCFSVTSSLSVQSQSSSSILGVNFISGRQTDWQWQLGLFRQGNFDVAKVQIPPGFGTDVFHVEDLIASGIRHIVLRTEDCQPFPDEVRREFVDRGFYDLVRRTPHVTYYLEIGNEAEVCGLDIPTYKQGLIDTITTLKSNLSLPNLEWLASMPVRLESVKSVLAGGEVERHYDGIGFHLYGHYFLNDGGGSEWVDIHNYLLSHTSLPLYVTEAGIHDSSLSMRVKAERILDWQRHASPRIKMLLLWTIGRDTQWPMYELTPDAMAVFAVRNGGRYFPETGHTIRGAFLEYWETRGGLFTYGYPLTEEFIDPDTGLRSQVMERSIFEWHPNNPPEYRVLLRRLGAEYLQRQ